MSVSGIVVGIASSQTSTNVVNNNDKDINTHTTSRHKPPFFGFGILCCILSGLVFSFNAMFVKLITSIDAIQISASRCYVQFLFLLPYVFYNWRFKSFDIVGPPGMFKFLVLRGFLGSTAAICLYQSLVRISLGDSVTLSFSNVIFAGCLGYCLLGETLTILDVIMSVLAMIGIILISKPAFIFGGIVGKNTTEELIGVGFGLACGVLAGLTILTVRKLGKETHASLNVLYYSIAGSLSTTCIVCINNSFKFPCLNELPYVILLGLTGLGAQLFMTVGLHYERATTFSVLRSFQIVLVFILQVTILHDNPSVVSVVGAGVVFLSIFAITFRKVYNVMSKKESKDD